MSQKADIHRFLRYLILSLVGAGLLQACSQPPCPYSKPTFIIKETSKLTEDSILLVVNTQLESLKKLKTSRPQTEIELNIGRLSGLKEKVNERSYYGNHKMETITLVTDLMCTYWDLRFNRSLRKEERKLWEEKFFQLDQQLSHFIFPDTDTIIKIPDDDAPITNTVPKPFTPVKKIEVNTSKKVSYCVENIQQLAVTQDSSKLELSGIDCSKKAGIDTEVLWLFVQKKDLLYSKTSSHLRSINGTWRTTFQLNEYQTYEEVVLMKFPRYSLPQLKKLGYSGYEIQKLEKIGGILLDKKLIPPPT